jgi:hypothetical protein
VDRTPEGNVELELSRGGTHELHAVWRVP